MKTKEERLVECTRQAIKQRKLWDYSECLLEHFPEGGDGSPEYDLLQERAWEAATEYVRLSNLMLAILDEEPL